MSNAISYWDLTEAERAALTRDDVAKHVDFELMQKGVLKPKALELAPEPELSLPKSTYYRIEDKDHTVVAVEAIAFRTEREAQDFLALRPLVVARDWSVGHELEFVKAVRDTAEIQMAKLPSSEAVDAHRAALKELQAAKTENEKRRREHEEQTKKVDQALRGLWDDWHACVSKRGQMERVRETFEEYRGMAGGDAAVAAKFLRKVFPADTIAEAEGWTGVSMSERADAAAE